MIHKFRCNACGGTYSEASQDGVPYQHVCGPLPATNKEPERERPDKRDENALLDEHGYEAGIRSEGAGVTCLTDTKIRQPRWISRLKQVHAKRGGKSDS